METLARDTNAWACYDCGKCTATCPIARIGADYSPRRQVLAAGHGRIDELLADPALYTCLTCARCDAHCPVEVSFVDLVRGLRERAFDADHEPECPHGGALHAAMRLMARGSVRQDRLGWLEDALRVDPAAGRVFLWTGCTPHFDAFFPELEMHTLDGTRAAIRLLNRLGEVPVVSPDERCCGHDLLWRGDRPDFEALARHNVELVRASGAELVIAPCAECARTWRLDYAPFFDGPGPRVQHLAEYLVDNLERLEWHGGDARRVTFQDPCRLSRHLGEVEAPREVLRAVPGLTLEDMPRSGGRGLCCAGGTWVHCDQYSKKIQVDRLLEARATGAEVLVTACPKCQIHLACAMKDSLRGDELRIEMQDLGEVVMDGLEEATQ